MQSFRNEYSFLWWEHGNIMFFAKHSGSTLGWHVTINEWPLSYLFNSSKETSFTYNRIESVREIPLRYVTSPIWGSCIVENCYRRNLYSITFLVFLIPHFLFCKIYFFLSNFGILSGIPLSYLPSNLILKIIIIFFFFHILHNLGIKKQI